LLNNDSSQNNTNSRNYFSVQSAEELCEILSTKLENLIHFKLNLFWNRIEKEGAESLIKSIKMLSSLKSLHLNFDWNRINEGEERSNILASIQQIPNLEVAYLEIG
jgi:hypothetical protein